MAEREQREPEGSGPEEPGLGSTQRDLSRDQTIRPGGRTKKRDDLGSGPTFRPKRTDSKAGDLDSDPTLRGRSPGPQRGGARELMEQERQVGRQAGDKVFGRYELQKVLGRGGMGIVWLATDLELHREVALKFLPDALAYNEGALADLKRETKRALELTHPHIVRVHDWVSDGEHAAVCMEYVDGKPLSTLRAVKPSGVFEVEEVREWIGQLCEALEYAHTRAGVVHRDLKPQNLMINARGELKVTDFGIARSLGETMTRTTGGGGGVSGSPGYMSPQQWQGKKSQPSDDLYSLGATIYELLTGKPPFYSGDVKGQTLEETPPSMAERREELGIEGGGPIAKEWEQVVAACLAKEPEKRPATAKALLNCLNEGSMTGAIAPLVQARGKSSVSRRRASTESLPGISKPSDDLTGALRAEKSVQSRPQTPVERPLATPSPKHPIETPTIQPPTAANSGRVTAGVWLLCAFILTLVVGVLWYGIKDFRVRAARDARIDLEMKELVSSLPSENTLGMKFLPVPGTRVLFSVWETRVKDYAAYAAANSGVDGSWRSPGFPQGDTHPVVNVSWNDAVAFCRWLTATERQAARLKADQEYRLPTDAEWSYAAGIGGKEEGSTPKEKDSKLMGVYPWGQAPPSPRGFGNYALGKDRDGYDQTSPVGSYGKCELGLYDMGGNVAEWCQDFYSGQSGDRVLRGGSWRDNVLDASDRDAGDPSLRRQDCGFRVVVGSTGL